MPDSAPPLSVFKKLTLAVFSVAIPLALAEGGLRLGGFRHKRIEVPLLIWNKLEDKVMEEGAGLHLYDPAQLWRPRPGAPIPWGDEEVVNEQGWRGPTRERTAPLDTLRVVTLGDSSTFGLGVAYGESYSGRLEERLRADGRKAEVIDGGVVGFTVRQGLERYREVFSAYRPDVVVAAFGAVNDHYSSLDLPDRRKIEHQRTQLAWRKRLSDGLRDELRILHAISWLQLEAHGGKERLAEVWLEKKRREHELMKSSGRVEWPGERRVSLEDFSLALTELRDLVGADGGRLVLVSMPRKARAERDRPVLTLYSRAVMSTAAREGLQVADARGAFHRVIAGGRPEAELFVNDFWHPSASGHDLIAEGLVALVLDADLARWGSGD
ncbi:MAG: GDSL-type esterase/lipase family protein [Planctomycetota bacterium]|nr:GDSL-type esterase/lipase family protein [Planctomycetota bacterium]